MHYAVKSGPIKNRYQVQSLIHESLTCDVSRAFDHQTQSTVVIKAYKSGYENIFLRESGAAYGLKHRHVVQCKDLSFTHGSSGAIVYEDLGVQSMQSLIDQRHQFSESDLLNMTRQIALGLSYLHGEQLIHCDIKPANIMVRSDSDEMVIADLGAACQVREAKQAKHYICSPAYCAPERNYEDFGAASDFYSLGVMLFQLITGQLPFFGTMQEIRKAHLSQRPNLDLIRSIQLRHLVKMLLMKDPSERIKHSDDLLKLLSAIQTDKLLTVSSTQTGTTVQHLNRKQLKFVRMLVLPADLNQIAITRYDNHPCLSWSNQWYCKRQVDDVFVMNQSVVRTGPWTMNSQGELLFAGDELLKVGHNRQIEVIAGNNNETLSVSSCAQYISVMAKRYIRRIDARTGKSDVLPMRQYINSAQIVVDQNGRTLCTSGLGGNRVELRDEQFELVQHWELNDPVHKLVLDGNSVLVATQLSASVVKVYALDIATGAINHAYQDEEVICLQNSGQSIVLMNRLNGLIFIRKNEIRRTVIPGHSVEQFSVSVDESLIVVVNHDHRGLIGRIWQLPTRLSH